MGRIKKFMKSFKSLSTEWVDGVCKDLDDLGYTYDRIKIKRYYKKRFLKSKYISGETIKTELDSLKEYDLVKPNLKKMFISNKKKVEYLKFELHKNRHLLLLNSSMLELSYKECEEIAEKRKTKDYHFEFLLEDLNLQLFYENRKLNEFGERILLLSSRITLLEKVIDLKNANNTIIDDFMKEFHNASDSKDTMYQYEIEASNLLNEKKYPQEDISADLEELDITSTEYSEMHENREQELNIILLLKGQIDRVESIIDLTTEEKDKDFIKKMDDLKQFYETTLEEEKENWVKKKKELEKSMTSKKGL
ncbi:MAG: hypothetical protein IKF36_04140 [Bacilli bacterium]|nr:hypothetical protein [Bacilli bacterium]